MGSWLARGACRPLIVDEIFARMRNEECGGNVGPSPRMTKISRFSRNDDTGIY